MTGELTRWESDGESLSKSLERDEIFEYLSEGFCRQCKSLLQTRIHSLVNRKNYLSLFLFFFFDS